MFSYPEPQDVVADIGEKVVTGFLKAVDQTRDDLENYRQSMSRYAADASGRGLANWIHDRLWAHVNAILGELPGVTLVDSEPRREMWVGTRYKFRFKRHTDIGAVRTYPTQTALEFFGQAAVQWAFDGFEELHLTFGYVWDAGSRTVGPAVISLHSELNTPVWMRQLDDLVAVPAAGATTLPPRDEPSLPDIEFRHPHDEKESGTDSS